MQTSSDNVALSKETSCSSCLSTVVRTLAFELRTVRAQPKYSDSTKYAATWLSWRLYPDSLTPRNACYAEPSTNAGYPMRTAG